MGAPSHPKLYHHIAQIHIDEARSARVNYQSSPYRTPLLHCFKAHSFTHTLTHASPVIILSGFLLATTIIPTLRYNVKNHLASLFTPVLGADNLNGLVLGLVTGYLDFGAGLLAKVVDGATAGTNDKPFSC